MAQDEIPFGAKIRPAMPSDHAFMITTWQESTRRRELLLEASRHRRKAHECFVRSMVTGGKTSAIIACNPKLEDSILGYVVHSRIGSEPVLHWIFVKRPFREKGLGAALVREVVGERLGDVIVRVTWQNQYTGGKRREDWRLTYDPLLVASL